MGLLSFEKYYWYKEEINNTNLSKKIKKFLEFILQGGFYDEFITITDDNLPLEEQKKIQGESLMLVHDILKINEGKILNSDIFDKLTNFSFCCDIKIDEQLEYVIECVKINLQHHIFKRYNNDGEVDELGLMSDLLKKDFFDKYFRFALNDDKDLERKVWIRDFIKAHYLIDSYYIGKNRTVTKECIDDIIAAFEDIGCYRSFVRQLKEAMLSKFEVKSKNNYAVLPKTPDINYDSIKKNFSVKHSGGINRKITDAEHEILQLINNDRKSMMPNRCLNSEEIIDYIALMIRSEWSSEDITKFLKNYKKITNSLEKANGIVLSAFDMIVLEAGKLEYYSRRSEELKIAYEEMMEYFELYKLFLEEPYCLDSNLLKMEEQFRIVGESEVITEQYSALTNDWQIKYDMTRFASDYLEYKNMLENAYRKYLYLIPKDFNELYEVVVAKSRVKEKM